MARWLGIAASGLTRETTALDQIAAAVGQAPTVATWYESWSWKRAFPVAEADRLRLWGVTPQVTWEPWDPAAGKTQPAYTLAAIASGAHDPYIDAWAADIKTWAKPLRLRFAHEMNRPGYPWSVGVNGNTAAQYVAAWRHVRSRFYRLGITNVWWSWCAQNVYPGLTPLAAVYPGDAYVDEVSLDGYNWPFGGQPWSTFRGVFRAGVEELTALTTKPITIGETGCPETGGDKAGWIRDMWTQLAEWPQVKGLLWFNFNKETDWRIDSTPASLDAFKVGLPGFTAF